MKHHNEQFSFGQYSIGHSIRIPQFILKIVVGISTISCLGSDGTLSATNSVSDQSVTAGKILVETDKRLPAGKEGPWGFRRAISRDSHLPSVLLIGDSVLNGYRATVVRKLQGKANVDAWVNPYHQASAGLQEQLRSILSANGPYAVIHFNMGLHGFQKGRIPEGQFEILTLKLVQIIEANAPDARLIWASTTPVRKKGQTDKLDSDINSIIIKHNAMAAKVMEQNKIPIDDLYTLMSTQLNLAAGDQFHWKTEGSRIQGVAVANIIAQNLPPRPAPKMPLPTSPDGK